MSGFGGGAVLTNDLYEYRKIKYWSEGSKATPAWNQHDELGYEYRMSPLTAVMIASQMVHLDESIEKKKAIYEHYKERLSETTTPINFINEGDEPNYNITGMLCDSNLCFEEARTDRDYVYTGGHGTASPMEIYEGLAAFNVESHPMYKPMHL